MKRTPYVVAALLAAAVLTSVLTLASGPSAASAKPTATSQVKNQVVYVCEMDGILSETPGRCPKCGMPLKVVSRADVYYQCPMHPNLVSDKPGKCPECGMNLELRVKKAQSASHRSK